ncbi:ArnT family glycosyltransferase [Oribacterium sp. KHPX15]|uniref:ArnT family glycosyltransferase n=1 Tax=Oribacterium sp. KHPX15 TaxID=1855342 RepID=UPI000B80E774|nr:hypothetical protein [Oribacterium sp. KHPX15]
MNTKISIDYEKQNNDSPGSMGKVYELIADFAAKIAWGIFFCFIFWLFIVTGYSTVRLGDMNERSYIIHDSMVQNLLFSVVILFLMTLIFRSFKRFKEKQLKDSVLHRIDHRKVTGVMLLAFTIMCFIFVVTTQHIPRSDQKYVVDCAEEILNHDYSCFEPEGYLDYYPNQYGIVLIMYCLTVIFGSNNYLIFRLINVLALGLLFGFMRSLTEKIFDVPTSILNCVVLLMFLPLALYVTFVYGNILGLTAGIGSLYYLYGFMEEKGRWKLAAAVALSAFSVLIKQNYMIFTLGLGIYCLMELLKRRNLRTLAAFFCILFTLSFGSIVPGFLMKQLTGIDKKGGLSSVSFIVMGLQDNPKRFNGWYNEYNYVSYKKAGFDKNLQTERCLVDLKERLNEFAEKPLMAVSFFSGKNISQWCNPDFQAFWINQGLSTASDFKSPGWIVEFLSVYRSERISKLLNLLQFWIIAGALIFAMFSRKDNVSLCFAVIFIGGFLFHTVWEAKGQYTLPYFVCLIPLSCSGWMNTVRQSDILMDEVILKKWKFRNKYLKPLRISMLMLACMIYFSICSSSGIAGSLLAMKRYSDFSYQVYLRDNTSERFSGIRTITPLEGAGCEITGVKIETNGDRAFIHLVPENMYLDVAEQSENTAEEHDEDLTQLAFPAEKSETAGSWFIKKGSDDGYYILLKSEDEQALTAGDNGEIFLAPLKSDDRKQIWQLLPLR